MNRIRFLFNFLLLRHYLIISAGSKYILTKLDSRFHFGGKLFGGLIITAVLCLIPASYSSGDQENINIHRAMILDLSGRNKSGDTELVAFKHCFDIFAVQYTITDNIAAAARSSIIFTAGDLRNTTFTPGELQQLYDYVENGGVIVSQVVIGNKLFPLFGISNLSESKKRYTINFKNQNIDCALQYIDRPEERTVSLGNKKLFREVIWTHAFGVKDAEILASTEDNKTIFSVNHYGSGSAYALGVSLSDAVLLPHVGNDYEAQRTWINGFEPGSDVFLLIIKSLYENYTSPFIYLSTIPYGKKSALMLSHDVDAQLSFINSIKYAEMEKKYSVSATYFITTKYFKDASDIGYYDEERKEYIRKVKQLGGDIGSHTVSHSITFEKFPVGTPDITIGNYSGTVKQTVFGEVKLSKELLDRDIPSQNTIIFRAGYLRYPDRLIESLEKCGYLYDSTFSANDIMCNYAFKAFRQRKVGSQESSIIEIPVIFDDSQGLLNQGNEKELVEKWVDVINANRDNEAISVLLIHPSETGYKLQAEEDLLSRLQDRNVWIGNLSAYGEFWSARNRLEYDSAISGKILTIRIKSVKIDERISFCIKDTEHISTIRMTDAEDRPISFTRTQYKDKIFLNINGR